MTLLTVETLRLKRKKELQDFLDKQAVKEARLRKRLLEVEDKIHGMIEK